MTTLAQFALDNGIKPSLFGLAVRKVMDKEKIPESLAAIKVMGQMISQRKHGSRPAYLDRHNR